MRQFKQEEVKISFIHKQNKFFCTLLPSKRNINNLRYVDDTILMTKNKEELKSLLMRVKEESENARLKLNIQKTKVMASGPISWQIDGEKVETVTDCIFLGSKITVGGDCSHKMKPVTVNFPLVFVMKWWAQMP